MSEHHPGPPSLHRPFWIATANRMRRPLLRLGLLDDAIKREHLLDAAATATGLDDFGDNDFLAPLDRLLQAYRRDAHLNTIGLAAARTYLLQLLGNRLRLADIHRRVPAVAAQPVKQPLFIIGLPRTGSTLLHELLAQDPQFRTPLTWEVMYPMREQGSPRRRRQRTALNLALANLIAPDFRRTHPIGAGLPQECIAIQAHTFRSILFHTTNRVTSYQRWLLDHADWTPAYTMHRQFLQHLSFQDHLQQRRRPTWLLKAPGHLFSLDALIAAYPDARLIQTHRDPLTVVSSLASHCAAVRQAFSDRYDPSEIGREWADAWRLGLLRTMTLRKQDPRLDQAIIDINYHRFINDPLDHIQRIYDTFALDLAPSVVDAMRRYLASHRQDRFGKHQYRPTDFGLDAARQRHAFADYIERFIDNDHDNDNQEPVVNHPAP